MERQPHRAARFLIASATLGAVACGTNSVIDAGVPSPEASTVQDAARTCGAKRWYPVDAANRCLQGLTEAPGLCEVGVASSKGLYPLCVRAPAGGLYVGGSAGGQLYEGAGYTFGPRAYVESRLGLPTLSEADEATCQWAVGLLGPSAPIEGALCAAGGDAGLD